MSGKRSLSPSPSVTLSSPKKTKSSQSSVEGAKIFKESGAHTTIHQNSDATTSKSPKMLKKQEDLKRKQGILETGKIWFFYRNKVSVTTPHSIDDIARFFILLLPESNSKSKMNEESEEGEKLHRLILIGKKKLPDPLALNEFLWGKVLRVESEMIGLREELGPKDYSTMTRGDRHIDEARSVGRGRYIIYGGTNFETHLAYRLTLPHELGEVQKEVNVQHEGAISIQVSDPAQPNNHPAFRNTTRIDPGYPLSLSKLFSSRKFIPCNPIAFLDYEHTELLFTQIEEKMVEEVIDKEALEELDKEAVGEEMKFNRVAASKALDELGMEDFEVGALEGKWV